MLDRRGYPRNTPRMTDVCPHCLHRALEGLDVHLRFTCPVLRPKENEPEPDSDLIEV